MECRSGLAVERLCGCGSALSLQRCCELNLAGFAAAHASRHLVPLEERARQARQTGENEEAERLALDVLELSPGRLAALRVLYEIRRDQGVAKAAEALIRRIAALDPNDFWATNEVALLLLAKGVLADAERFARNAIRIAPEAAQAHYLMGLVLTQAHRPALGEFHYRRAMDLASTRDPVLLSNLALCLKNQGKMQMARAYYRESLGAAPQSLHTLLGLARLEEADRNLAAAAELLDQADALQPGHPTVALLRATVLGRSGKAQDALALLDRMQDSATSLGADEYLEKGRLLDRMGHYAEAFEAFAEGKRRLAEDSGQAYLAEQAQTEAARRRGFFTAPRLHLLPRAAVRQDVPQPIFVIGFPRSGTTLLEQTLTAHSRIAAGDELPLIHEITRLMPRMLESPLSYPDALAELWMADHRDDLDNLRDHYLRRVAQLGIASEPGVAWFTDKMPLNETDLGLISMLFPASPLLHMIRHPLDVVLSVFSNLLTHGFFCAYALESAARHYVLVADLVEHYRAELNLRYCRLRYEDIVDDQEASIRRALAFIGEDFESACLDFHENTRYARTASYAQVSEKLYDRSRYRYRHYLDQLQPVIPILRPVIERLGYTI